MGLLPLSCSFILPRANLCQAFIKEKCPRSPVV
jgi:hypothetical protein